MNILLIQRIYLHSQYNYSLCRKNIKMFTLVKQNGQMFRLTIDVKVDCRKKIICGILKLYMKL